MDTEIEIKITPIGRPIITYGISDDQSATIALDVPCTLRFAMKLSKGEHKVFIDFRNKTNDTPDMAVIIDSVSFGGITTDRMKWAGLYYPDYPEPWASTQTNLPVVHANATFLGWNGRWELPFMTPIYTWIHRLENLGWLYN